MCCPDRVSTCGRVESAMPTIPLVLVPKVTIMGNHFFFFLPEIISLLKALEAAQNSTDLGELSRIHYVTKIVH